MTLSIELRHTDAVDLLPLGRYLVLVLMTGFGALYFFGISRYTHMYVRFDALDYKIGRRLIWLYRGDRKAKIHMYRVKESCKVD